MICGPTFYAVRVLLSLLFIDCFMFPDCSRQWKAKLIIAGILTTVCGISTGIYFFIMIIFPAFVFMIEQVVRFDSIKAINNHRICFVLIETGCLLVGMFFGKIVGITSIATYRTWTSVESIWKNIGAVFQGLMILTNVLPLSEESNVSILSRTGMIHAFGILLFFVVLVAVVFLFVKKIGFWQDDNILLQFVADIVICNVILLSLFQVQYGGFIFEERYLLTTYMGIIIALGFFLNSIVVKRYLYIGLLLLSFVGLIGMDIKSDRVYIYTNTTDERAEEIKDVVADSNAELVYFYGSTIRIFGRMMRIFDLEHVYKCVADEGWLYHGGDYLYYEGTHEKYNGETYLVVDRDNNKVPEEKMKEFTIVKTIDNLYIYYCQYNPFCDTW